MGWLIRNQSAAPGREEDFVRPAYGSGAGRAVTPWAQSHEVASLGMTERVEIWRTDNVTL